MTAMSRRRFLQGGVAGAATLALSGPGLGGALAYGAPALDRRLTSRFARNGDVRLHYMIGGTGSLVLFLHGFPGWWGMWRPAMEALIADHTVAAMDMRAFNLSGKPRGVAAYGAGALLGDVQAVLADTGHDTASLVGHDFGGGLAWGLALGAPQVITKLVVLNSLHPWSLQNALHNDPRQARASRYAQELRRPDALRRPIPKQIAQVLPRRYDRLTADALAALLAVPGSALHREARTAMRRSYLQGAVDYYVNFPSEPYADPGPRPAPVQCPTLVLFGRDDPFLLVSGLADLPSLVAGPLKVQRIAKAGHFVLQDAPRAVLPPMRSWLRA